MPRLLRGMARTAAVVGTATAVSGNVSRRQARRNSGDDAAPQAQPSPQTPTSTGDQFDQLEKLGKLKDEGVLTQAEFDQQKKQILG